MLKAIFLFMLLFTACAFTSQAQQIQITWYGHACFLIKAADGTTVLTDPIHMGAYKVPADVKPDVVTVTHEHGDHNQVDTVSGKPLVLRGLKQGAKAFTTVDQTVKGVRIYTVPSYHDKVNGAKRGLNAIFVYDIDGLRFVHLGDLGHCLTPIQIEQIGPVDVLMIPVGGKYTIFGADAHTVVEQLKPTRAVIPMHYKTAEAAFLPYTAEDFVKGKKEVLRVSGNVFVVDTKQPTKAMQYILMDYK